MQAVADQFFTATLVDPAGDITYLGARIEVPVTREIVSFWREATLTGATWSVDIEAPIDPGDYLLVWRTGDPEPPDYETFIPLHVIAAGVVVPVPYDLVTAEDIRPTIEDIVALEQTRTAAGGGGEIREFTDSTRPSADEVENLIDQAVGAVLNQISETRFSDAHFDGARHAAALYTAMLIEGGYFREGMDSSAVDLWRTLFNQAIVNLQGSIQEELRQARLLRGLV